MLVDGVFFKDILGLIGWLFLIGFGFVFFGYNVLMVFVEWIGNGIGL